MSEQRIPNREYQRILRSVPILCVDGVIVDARGRFLLVKRVLPPLQGEWWPPGGRVLRGEALNKAFIRKMREELGNQVKLSPSPEPVGVFPLILPERHSISIVFEASYGGGEIILDRQSSEWKWARSLPAEFDRRTQWWG